MKDLYRLVYTSINHLKGSDSDRAFAVAEILALSQKNNSKVGVTGALLFNSGCFAQVLEGPRKAVETTFERIQRDARHSDVSVLQCEPVETRGFSNWSMAFIGHSAKGRSMWDDMASRTGFDGSRIEGEQLFATLRDIVVEEEGLAAEDRLAVAPVPPVPVSSNQEVAATPVHTIDVGRVRAELQDRLPGMPSPAPAAPVPDSVTTLNRRPEPAGHAGEKPAAAELVVLRAALDEERERTTALRRKLDDARIALAVASDDAHTLRRHRDHWAERARMLAAALCQDLTDDQAMSHGAQQHQAPPIRKAVAG